MAIVECSRCGRKYSDRQGECPACLERESKKNSDMSIRPPFLISAIVCVLALIVSFAYTGFKASDPEIQVSSEPPIIKAKSRPKRNSADTNLKEKELVNELLSTPQEDLVRRIEILDKLRKIAPDTSAYTNEYNFLYDEVYGKIGEKPWPKIEAKSYLRGRLNDPDSLVIEKCSPAIYTPDGWFFICDYRAKNKFNGYVKKQGAFTVNKKTVSYNEL